MTAALFTQVSFSKNLESLYNFRFVHWELLFKILKAISKFYYHFVYIYIFLNAFCEQTNLGLSQTLLIKKCHFFTFVTCICTFVIFTLCGSYWFIIRNIIIKLNILHTVYLLVLLQLIFSLVIHEKCNTKII